MVSSVAVLQPIVSVVLNSIQDPYIRFLITPNVTLWMLSQVQHDGGDMIAS